MRYYLLLCFLGFFLTNKAFASPPAKMVFFGDSLTDNGNLYRLDMHFLPKSPPYFEGRFSNGPTWAEIVGHDMMNTAQKTYSVYAWGGATAIKHHQLHPHTFPITLRTELDRYLFDTFWRDKSKTIFSIWIGGNDYLFDHNTDVDTLTSEVVDEITDVINNLIDHQATHFLLLSLPSLGKTPLAFEKTEYRHRLSELCALHNRKLKAAINTLQKANPSVSFVFVDIGYFFDDLLENPEKYNKSDHSNIQDTTHACWQGGYTKTELNTPSTQYNVPPNKSLSIPIETIAMTPDLREAYFVNRLAEKGIPPCANPDQYLFWDHIHPTAIGHKMIAARIKAALEEAGTT